mgnify:CR=1 FL=1
MITNFHTPKSTLLMMASAFADPEFIKSAYQEAIKEKYNFYFAPYRFNLKALFSALDDFRFKNYVFDMKRIIYANIKFYEEAIVRIDKLEELIKEEINH